MMWLGTCHTQASIWSPIHCTIMIAVTWLQKQQFFLSFPLPKSAPSATTLLPASPTHESPRHSAMVSSASHWLFMHCHWTRDACWLYFPPLSLIYPCSASWLSMGMWGLGHDGYRIMPQTQQTPAPPSCSIESYPAHCITHRLIPIMSKTHSPLAIPHTSHQALPCSSEHFPPQTSPPTSTPNSICPHTPCPHNPPSPPSPSWLLQLYLKRSATIPLRQFVLN